METKQVDRQFLDIRKIDSNFPLAANIIVATDINFQSLTTLLLMNTISYSTWRPEAIGIKKATSTATCAVTSHSSALDGEAISLSWENKTKLVMWISYSEQWNSLDQHNNLSQTD
jgi:hypothetical protein